MPDIAMSEVAVRHITDYSGITTSYDKFLKDLMSDLSFYLTLMYSVQILIIVLGALSTALVALQNDNNRQWSKPIAVVVTLFLTIFASVQSSFHLKENVAATTKLMSDTLDEALEVGIEMRKSQDEEQTQIAIKARLKKLNEFNDRQLRIWGNVGGVSVGSQ